jgi:hypothetical protein
MGGLYWFAGALALCVLIWCALALIAVELVRAL